MKIYGKILKTKEEKARQFKYDLHGWYYKIGDWISVEKDRLGNGYHRIGNADIAACSGKANQLLMPDVLEAMRTGNYGDVSDVMSWGYEGRGSDLLAAWLIGCAFSPGGHLPESRFCCVHQDIIDMVKAHHKQFSTEVIANLPDEWEMDTTWVKRWVMEREKQPA